MRLSEEVVGLLRCPACKSELEIEDVQFRCINSECRSVFPIVDGIPILIDDRRSLFRIDDFMQGRDTFFKLSERSRMRKLLRRLLPKISKNIGTRENYREFVRLLLRQSSLPKVLIVGGSVLGSGIEPLLSESDVTLVESDVSFGDRTALICDAHDIPFAECSFDGVVAEAALAGLYRGRRDWAGQRMVS